jgi:hypothetical protein
MKFRVAFPFGGPAFLGLALGCLVAGHAPAQSSQDVDRAQLGRTQTDVGYGTSGVENGQAVSTPNDADLGEQQILKRSDTYQPFTASVGMPFYWTSNAALSRTNEQDDFILAPAAAIVYQPRFTNTFYGFADVREQLFYYDEFDQLNFGAFDADVGLIYVLPQLENLTLRVQYNYNRLTEKDSFNDFFYNHAIIVNAEVPVRLGRAQQISFGTTANISATAEPEVVRRNDYEAYVGYTLAVSRAFFVNAVGRLVIRDYYHQNSRVDMSEIAALTGTYQFNRYFSATALSTFAANQSNHEVFDYKVGNVGGAVALSVKF